MILVPAGEDRPAEEKFRNGWQANSDGAGYAFCVEGKLVVRKPFFKLRDFLASFDTDYELHGKTTPWLVHFRFATHGPKNELNTHPYEVWKGEVCAAHNGVFSYIDPWAGESDTVGWCRIMLGHRTINTMMSKEFREFIETFDMGNKVVILAGDGRWNIINQDNGHWLNGCWYSNYSGCGVVYKWYSTSTEEKWWEEYYQKWGRKESEYIDRSDFHAAWEQYVKEEKDEK